MGESIKKGKCAKNLFPDNVEKKIQKVSANVKVDVKQDEVKELVAVSCNFS